MPLGFLFAVAYFWLAEPTWRFMAFGAVLILAGLLLRALASGYVRKNETLATSGPYAYTRNPLYLGSLLIGTGFCLAARNWWLGIALVIIFVAIYLPVIGAEETFLRASFPEFAEYTRRVPRFFPRLVAHSHAQPRGVNPSDGAFSFALYRQHREYNALLGALAMLAALIAKMLIAKMKF